MTAFSPFFFQIRTVPSLLNMFPLKSMQTHFPLAEKRGGV